MNGWKRMSEEAKAAFLAAPRTPSQVSEIKVRRLALWVLWRGATQDNPRSVYPLLAEIGQQDYNNPVLIELGWWTPRTA